MLVPHRNNQRRYNIIKYTAPAVASGIAMNQIGQLARMGYNAYKWAVGNPTPTAAAIRQAVNTGYIRRSTYRNNYRPRRRTYQKKGGVAKKVAKQQRQITKLTKLAKQDTGTHIWKKRHTGRVLASVNQAQHDDEAGCALSTLNTAMTNLKYYNPSVPGTLTTAAGDTGTFCKSFLFETIYSRITCTNNYQIPCKLTIYCCVPKEDTSIAPQTVYSSGLTDTGGVATTNALMYMTDSPHFTNLYNIEKRETKILQPGESLTCSYSKKNVEVETSYLDTHNDSYMKKYGGHIWTMRLEGILGHDTVADEQGFTQAGVDWAMLKKIVIKYNAGGDLLQYDVSDDSNTFTNGAVVSAKPLADNQAYSVS